MTGACEVKALARRDVAAIEQSRLPRIRIVRDFELAQMVRHARRDVLRTMRRCGTLRPWWDRSPLLILVAPIAIALAVAFAHVFAALIAIIALAWGLSTEPRLSRGERAEMQLLLTEYRNAAADALDARVDARARDLEWDVRYLWEVPED